MYGLVDDETREIITRYIREVRDEKIKSALNAIPYDSEGFELRRCLIEKIAAVR